MANEQNLVLGGKSAGVVAVLLITYLKILTKIRCSQDS